MKMTLLPTTLALVAVQFLTPPVLSASLQRPIMPPSDEQLYALDKGWLNGVNFGGWLLTEPSWMYDQFSAPAENDLVQAWRKQGGDQFALDAMKNHWTGYIPDAALDTIAQVTLSMSRVVDICTGTLVVVW